MYLTTIQANVECPATILDEKGDVHTLSKPNIVTLKLLGRLIAAALLTMKLSTERSRAARH